MEYNVVKPNPGGDGYFLYFLTHMAIYGICNGLARLSTNYIFSRLRQWGDVGAAYVENADVPGAVDVENADSIF